ncbi:MAG: MarR family winged helix-turn-helix transcriptional regulator [Nocardioidaceae bacterium]
MSHPNLEIEHEIFMLFRRTFAIHIQTSSGEYELDRSTYGILLLLDDEGPMRLGHIATAYRLDPSTITRQVQSAVSQGLVVKQPDPTDRRATILSLTEAGSEMLAAVRDQRSTLIGRITAGWTDKQRTEFLGALRRVNAALAGLLDAASASA